MAAFIFSSPSFCLITKIMKEFFKWIHLKEKLHSEDYTPPLVHEGDIWWIRFGENIGFEINGKSNLFSRPGIVLKKLSRKFYLVAPTTSKIKSGSWYISFTYKNRATTVCLHQIRTIDYRRLSSRMGQISKNDFSKIKEIFRELYK